MENRESEEQERARARRRSEAWKAEQEELKQAIAADAEEARKIKDIVDAQRREQFAHGHAPRFVLSIVLGLIVLLVVERNLIEQRLDSCLNPRNPHNYGCADVVADSFWTWLLPSDRREELHAAQEAFHGH